MMHSFCEGSACRYVFQMPEAQTLSPFSAAYMKAIRTLSCDTTPAYAKPIGEGVLCP